MIERPDLITWTVKAKEQIGRCIANGDAMGARQMLALIKDFQDMGEVIEDPPRPRFRNGGYRTPPPAPAPDDQTPF